MKRLLYIVIDFMSHGEALYVKRQAKKIARVGRYPTLQS